MAFATSPFLDPLHAMKEFLTDFVQSSKLGSTIDSPELDANSTTTNFAPTARHEPGAREDRAPDAPCAGVRSVGHRWPPSNVRYRQERSGSTRHSHAQRPRDRSHPSSALARQPRLSTARRA